VIFDPIQGKFENLVFLGFVMHFMIEPIPNFIGSLGTDFINESTSALLTILSSEPIIINKGL
jgi:hypothetical protein